MGHPDPKKGDLCLLHQNKGICRLQSFKHCSVNRAVLYAWDAKVCTAEINYSAKAVTTAQNTVFEIRNLPNKITADTGKNVTKSRKLILESMESSLTHKDLKEIQSNWPQITWSVNPPDASIVFEEQKA